MNSTKRSQNKCDACGYTWYPRGKDKSLKCPNCGSNEVSIIGGGGLILGLIFVGWLIFGNKEKPPEAPRPEVTLPVAVEVASEPPIATNEALPSKAPETKPFDPAPEPVIPSVPSGGKAEKY